jgi:hypothetical protein
MRITTQLTETKMRPYTFSRSIFSEKENQAVLSDLSVEVFDGFAVPALQFTAMHRGLFRENHLCLAPRCGTTVAL